jgi:hypothetical protein
MTDASESAALVLRMKRELMDLVKAAEYGSALMVCDKLAAVVPRDALVEQYRVVLREKVAMDEANEALEDEEDGDGEEGSGEEAPDGPSSGEEDGTSESASSSDEEGDEEGDAET